MHSVQWIREARKMNHDADMFSADIVVWKMLIK